ncbi:hypothetical protein SERLA73DRAFT_101315 [Serpula lacrymans var. lacrymans S7.3]|uniref:Uncharacterized protein n=2 Tax=Serpula lacrymans var. lacrymans TaxID=341189 RepID=F8PJ25_SERL3|nr:uncharacterized protein SERLADRAFT_444879 [Serpula lacrymans var. lacrymans S7.9]EGO03186.1 hypothetical protein SERLA73DRAFT_101315 [Serpula lacrymans var. lacrymans S7.3]EGO28964.1 hypothetical protein SERLADRAFT_444879 [Serpula lacrymans var. lacrymans S7.9]
MKFSTAFAAISIASVHQLAQALPAKRASNSTGGYSPSVIEVLNFALTLEHLESTFYAQGVQNYTQQDFVNAGLPDFAQGRFKEICDQEATHVSFLSGVLGSQAVNACTYNFPVTDPKSFAAFSYMLENVGVSAYSGAAKLLVSDTTYISAAASILAVEARHSAWVNSAVLMANPWNSAFDTPLDLNQAYTIASGLITSCPSNNMALPVKAFPMLTFPSTAQPNQTVQVSFSANTTSSNDLYVAFLSGLTPTIVPLKNNTVTIPGMLQGVVFALVVNSSNSTSDNVTVAGPSFLSFDYNQMGQAEIQG